MLVRPFPFFACLAYINKKVANLGYLSSHSLLVLTKLCLRHLYSLQTDWRSSLQYTVDWWWWYRVHYHPARNYGNGNGWIETYFHNFHINLTLQKNNDNLSGIQWKVKWIWGIEISESRLRNETTKVGTLLLQINRKDIFYKNWSLTTFCLFDISAEQNLEQPAV